MTMTVKKFMIILGAIFALILCANYFITASINNLRKSELTNKTDSVITKNDTKEKDRTEKPTEMRPWKETSPEKLAKLKKYGIRIKPRNYGPSTPDEWSEYVEKRITEEKIFESEEAKEVIKAARVSEEEYKKIMEVNKEHEEAIKKLLKEDPFNKAQKERLQNIYKLQAVGKVLKNKVVVKNNTPAIAEPSASVNRGE